MSGKNGMKWATVKGVSHLFENKGLTALCGAVRLKRTKLRDKPATKKTCSKCESIAPNGDFEEIELVEGDTLMHGGKRFVVVGGDETYVYLKEQK